MQIRLSELLSLKSFVPSKGKGRHGNSLVITGETGARYVYKLDELRRRSQDSPILEYANGAFDGHNGPSHRDIFCNGSRLRRHDHFRDASPAQQGHYNQRGQRYAGDGR